jgi:hypothetical protein
LESEKTQRNENSVKNNSEIFLEKTLGDDFLESLQKFDLWKPDTKSVTDHNEIFQGLQIVPRVIMSLLIQELMPMNMDDTKEIKLPVASDSLMRVTKFGPDVYSGEIIDNNKKLTEFKFRSIPGIGLVIMSAYQLYSMDELEKEPSVSQDKQSEINRIIDERLNLHSLVNKVVDGKIQQKDAVQQLFMAKLNSLYKEQNQIKQDHKEIMAEPKEEPKPAAIIILQPKKNRPLSDFVENRKKKLGKKEFSIEMAKSEIVDCPDCGQNIFNGSGISSCLCFGQDMGRKVFLKKTEDGIKVSFPKSWSTENIEMLLEVLRRKNG